MTAMETYRAGIEDDDEEKQKAIDRAVKTLDLSHVTTLLKTETGRNAAIFLKEVIDRVIEIDYDYVPPGSKAPEIDGYWRLKNTEIVIRRITEGPRQGEFLFSSETVDEAKYFFDLVRDYPYVVSPGGAGYKDAFLESAIPSYLKGDFFGFPKWQAVGIFLAIFLGFVFKYITERLLKLAKKVATISSFEWDDRLLEAIEGPLSYCVASGVWFASLYLLRLEGIALEILSVVVQVIFSISVIWTFYRMAGVLSHYVAILSKKTDFLIDDQLVPLVSRALKTFILIFGILIALQNLGINVMSVIAGLGLGGLAFALAAKDTAANLFGSLMIFWDRPFKLGDWVKFGGVEGTVEEVGFRSTRVRTFYDSQITVPNATVANASIDNLGRRTYRRVKTVIGVTYDTGPETLEVFLEGIKEIIKANKFTRKDYFHVVFNNYGPSSLDILLYFFLQVPDWSQELVQKQNIFMEIKRLAEKLGVSFAFPSQSIYVESTPEQGSAEDPADTDAQALLASAKAFGPGGVQSKSEGLGLFVPPFAEGKKS